jgi:hypothetical protein
MPGSVRYVFRQAGRECSLLYAEASSALCSAVLDLHEQRAEPVAVYRGGQVLYDRALIDRAYRACRAELVADPWKVPSPLRRLAAREQRG